MAEILHQLRLVVYSIMYRILNIPGGAGFVALRYHCTNQTSISYMRVNIHIYVNILRYHYTN